MSRPTDLERLHKEYDKRFATLALKVRTTKDDLCIALLTDSEAKGGELRMVYCHADQKVYIMCVYDDGKYCVNMAWSATAAEVLSIIKRSNPNKMRQFMLEMLARKTILYSYPEED